MPEKELDKNKLIEEFINKPVDINNLDYFYYFLSIIRGTKFGAELMNTHYSQIEAKFITILNELTKIDDIDYKVELYYELISSNNIPLIEKNVGNILNLLDKREDSYVKRSIFDFLVYTLKRTHLLENMCTVLLNSLEKIDDEYERKHAFSTLMFSIRETSFLEGNVIAILDSLDTIGDEEVKRSAFYNLTSIIRETHLSEENITAILSFADKFSGKNSVFAFCDIISLIKFSDLREEQKIAKYSLIGTKFPDILDTINEMKDDTDKRSTLCHLLFPIRRTCLLEDNFTAILNTIEKIIDDTERRYSLSYVISAIEKEKLFKEKVMLIKDRFPEYSDELMEMLK